MGRTLVSGSGNKIKNYVSLLPLNSRVAPVDIELGAITGVAAGGNTFTTASVAEATATGRQFVLAGGTTITFEWENSDTSLTETFVATIKGTEMDINGVETFVYDIPVTEASIVIEINETFPEGKNITATFTAITIPAKQRLKGGTAAGVSTTADKTDSTVHDDEFAFADGIVTSASWEMSWTANCLAGDPGFRRILRAATEAIRGREVYIWQEQAPPEGYTIGDTTHGVAVVTAFAQDYPSDGIVTYNCTFSGNAGIYVEGYQT